MQQKKKKRKTKTNRLKVPPTARMKELHAMYKGPCDVAMRTTTPPGYEEFGDEHPTTNGSLIVVIDEDSQQLR